MRILIIDDDKELCEFLQMTLSSDTHAVDSVHDGESGSFTARTNEYDIIILDYSLPKRNGLQVCGEIRKAGKMMPIIILSVIDSTMNKVNLLDEGADDYLNKPFSIEELRARIAALHRRPVRLENPVLQVDDLVLDCGKHIVMRGSKGVYLTRKEFSLLEYLMRNQNEVCSRGMIMEHVWNITSDPFSNTIEAHILNLRKKIGSRGRKELIFNIPGRGYKIKANK